MQSITFDNRLTIGNVLTIGTFVITLIVGVVTFQQNSASQSARLDTLEQNQKVLEQRVQLIERELEHKQTAIDKMQKDVERTVSYMQLLLDKNGIEYVK